MSGDYLVITKDELRKRINDFRITADIATDKTIVTMEEWSEQQKVHNSILIKESRKTDLERLTEMLIGKEK